MSSMKIFNCTFALLIAFTFLSCSKDKDKEKVTDKQTQKNTEDEEIDNPADTIMTPEESFSSAILIDYLNDSDDEDLAGYLETEIYKMGGNFTGVSVIEATPSTWLVMLEKDNTTKNYLLQKYLNVKTNENYFRMKETPLTVTDLILKEKVKTPVVEQKDSKK
jgi:hypothetical protein